MARPFLLLALVALLVASSWRRLEQPQLGWVELAPVLLLAVLPALVAVVTRSRLAVVAAFLGATIFAASAAFDIPLADAQPRDPQRDFFGPVLDGFYRGYLEFYDTRLPFNGVDFELMHAVVLVAVFAFVALAGVFLVRSMPVAASLALVAGVGWPATLNPGEGPLRAGAIALVGVLAILFVLRDRDRGRSPRGVPQAAAAGVVLVAVALVASSSPAVAKTAFLEWRSWDPHDPPADLVSVSYVWRSNYSGIAFPEKRTTVLRVKVEGPRRSLYWRATTLDDYTGQEWTEGLQLGEAAAREQVDAGGSLLPAAARDEEEWVRQDVTVEALRDTHLIGSAQPVRWRPGTDAPVQDANGDVVVLPRSLQRGQRYTVWSYVPRAKPSELLRFGGSYPEELDRYLEVVYEPLPDWATEGRSEWMQTYFEVAGEASFQVSSQKPLYDQARGVTARARTPYEAAVLLETWFREGGGFTYDENPPQALAGTPPLVDFVQGPKRGYCQHYAGAMALMLRLLGVPARVAAGFTSGTYDAREKEWVVTDHNAHTWVEVWFPGFGWLPFDPTPGRGQLAATYSAVSGQFNAGDAFEAAGGGLIEALEGISPSRAEEIRSRAQGRPGLESAAGQAGPSGSGGAAGVVRDQGPSLVALVLLVLAGAYAAVVVLKAVLRSLRFATRDPRSLAAACRRDVVGYLADQGMSVPPSATLADIGETLERYYAVKADALVRDLALARFGRPAEAREALGRLRRELRIVRRRLRGAISLPSRLRGAASLRSLAL